MSNYGVENIKTLSTREAFRQRVSVYLGSDDNDGMYEAFKEIINNATDEALAGYGNIIRIWVDENKNKIIVQDEGRGIPFGIVDGKNVLISIFTESHTGGKFDKNAYKNSSGLNGLGGTAVCMTSDFFEVKVIRDNKVVLATFEKGINKTYKEADTAQTGTGTTISFIPDKEVFKNATENYSYEKICEQIKNISFLNKGVHFIVTNQNGEEKEFYSENGIADFITDKVTKPLMSKPILVSVKDEVDEMEIAFIWTKDTTQSYVFVNGLMCSEGGSPVTGAKQKITSKIKKLTGYDFDGELIRKGLIYAINCKVAQPSFANQTKNKINNANLRVLAAKAFDIGLDNFSETADFIPIVEMMIKIQAAEKAADRARDAILNHNKEMNEVRKTKLAFINKLSDAEILGQDSILCIVEGDSAGSSVAMGRDTKKYGILRVKGKMLNSLKADEEKIFANEEIKLLLYALGIDINHYDSKKLRYGKVAICTDQDADGRHIALLILANLYYLCPKFLEENRLYWLQSPLYIEYDKQNNLKSWYYTEEDFDKKRAAIKNVVKRVKGLGQLSEKDLKATMFSTTGGQKMDQIEYTSEGIEQLTQLMGVDILPRKEFVYNEIDFSRYGEV